MIDLLYIAGYYLAVGVYFEFLVGVMEVVVDVLVIFVVIILVALSLSYLHI